MSTSASITAPEVNIRLFITKLIARISFQVQLEASKPVRLNFLLLRLSDSNSANQTAWAHVV
jgi:hypothetical protein